MKNILILLLLLTLFSAVQAQKKSKHPNPTEILLVSKEDQVIQIWIPLDENWPKFVPANLKHLLNNTPAFQKVNKPYLSSVPLTVLNEINNNNLKAWAYDVDPNTSHYKYSELTSEFLKTYITSEIENNRTLSSYQLNPKDTFNYYISKTMEVNLRVRDSLGTMIYTPLSITLILEDPFAPSLNFCHLDLNQAIFNKKNENQESINDILKKMHYEYYVVNYFYRKGNKTFDARINNYEIALAYKLAINNGGTELFKNKKQIQYSTFYLHQLPKAREKANKRWGRGGSY